MVEYYTGEDGKWYWRFKADNGRVIADGAQGYARKENARWGFGVLAKAILEARDLDYRAVE